MCLNNFSGDFKAPMNAAQLMVYEFLMFHENTDMLPSGDFYDVSLGDIDPAEQIMLVLFVIPLRNQLGWVEKSKEY